MRNGDGQALKYRFSISTDPGNQRMVPDQGDLASHDEARPKIVSRFGVLDVLPVAFYRSKVSL